MTEYRFVFEPQFQGDFDPYVGESVSSIELAEEQMSLIAKYTLYLHETSLMPDYTNFGFLERKESGGVWEEVDEDEL